MGKLDGVTTFQVDTAVLKVCKSINSGEIVLDRDALARTCWESKEFREWVVLHVHTAKAHLGISGTLPSLMQAFAAALTIGVEIGAALEDPIDSAS